LSLWRDDVAASLDARYLLLFCVAGFGGNRISAAPGQIAAEDEMEITEQKIGRITVIRIQGQSVIDQRPERLSQLVRDHLQDGDRLFVLNLAECVRMDSTGLGEVVRSQRLISDSEGVMKLAEVPLTLRGLFVVTNLIEILEIFDKERQAINSFGA
jgi:anti-anti-sigma factor